MTEQTTPARQSISWEALLQFLPFLWQFRYRVCFAIGCLILAKVSQTGVPLILKEIIDYLDQNPTQAALTAPLFLLVAFGLLRMGNTLFTELRELFFARVTHRVSRIIVLDTFKNLLNLSLGFHLSRKTGAVSRDIEKGISGIKNIMSFTLYSILPTLVELLIVIGYLLINYSVNYAVIALASLGFYVYFTIVITRWRTIFRRRMNEQDAKSNTRAIDALINYETVKYFGNEDYEARRYDQDLQGLESVSVTSQKSLSLLNLGQNAIISISAALILWQATQEVADGTISIGDLVLINAFMMQIYIPLNFLGSLYRMLAQSLTDLERMFTLLGEQPDIDDPESPRRVDLKKASVSFDRVSFSYEHNRRVLDQVSFEIPREQTVAVVGSSGSGKSTLARLLFRFYDCDSGQISINGVDLREMTQDDLRSAIGIVPQDTVLFNDTIGYNIAYGNPRADQEDVIRVAKSARIHDFISATPDGYETRVGERGLKLSGGEKQRVAIARALLKDPAILIFDEATSALDSHNEAAIQSELREMATDKTLLIIAHRLSTIIHADNILVMQQGRIIETGNHAQLMAAGGVYHQMWQLQQEEKSQSRNSDSKG